MTTLDYDTSVPRVPVEAWDVENEESRGTASVPCNDPATAIPSQRIANMMSVVEAPGCANGKPDPAEGSPLMALLTNDHTCQARDPEKGALLGYRRPSSTNDTDCSGEISTGSSRKQKAWRVILTILRAIALVGLLYFFICSLNLLGSAFMLLGGRTAGVALSSPLLNNPVCGLMIGLVTTAILQSSSTTTSIVVTTVAANLVSVQMAIPIIMGANIGTSVTGILVASAQAGERGQFRLAISGATCNDMFNWLTVAVLLPLEVATGCLYHLTTAIVGGVHMDGGAGSQDFLKALTKPFTQLIVQIDKTVLDDIATDVPGAQEKSLLKYWCDYQVIAVNDTSSNTTTEAHIDHSDLLGVTEPSSTFSVVQTPVPTEFIGITECRYLFHGTSLSDAAVGGILLAMAFVMLMTCLICMVKVLKSLLSGTVSRTVQRTINADFPGHAAWLTGYLAILVGMVLTVLVQSSSVVVSALTPLVGLSLVTVERVFPMMLGANLGTTSTAILAAFAASGDRMLPALQIALCHLFFNIGGILLWYVVPVMRKIPISSAKFLGRTMATYRWFAIVYGLGMFFVLPGFVFALSIPGWQVLAGVCIPLLCILTTVIVINILQKRKPSCLPPKIRTWDFLPEWMRSLRPVDRLLHRCLGSCKCCGKLMGQEPIAANSNDSYVTPSDSSKEISLDRDVSFGSSQRYFVDSEFLPDTKTSSYSHVQRNNDRSSECPSQTTTGSSNGDDICNEGMAGNLSQSSLPCTVPPSGDTLSDESDGRNCDTPV